MGHGIVNIGGAPKHASRHASGAADAVTPSAIGAAALVHKARHATGGADALAPSDIGAAGLDADNKVLADQASAKIVVIGASETLGLSRSGKHLLFNETGNGTVTIPAHTSVAYPIGTEITITDWLAGGRLSIALEPGVQLVWNDGVISGKTAPNQGATAIIKLLYGDTWLAAGF